ncbi:tripartite tricarboxylate transporter TctB family protein [Sporosarcina ureae]|uniref:tripartite tricarboxylate transporter TctB family protein n=1 Tax=Sporosarcina ureae TaxID=1571 RepID=UPI0026EFC5BE|nr:tripartite tricarboxylate transporter TctB family protein [Sporosarcina ureae]
MSEAKKDRYSGIALLLFSILLYFLIPYGIPGAKKGSDLGSDFFPKLLVVVMIVLSVGMIVKSIFDAKFRPIAIEETEESVEAEYESYEPTSNLNYKNVAIVFGIMLVHIFVLVDLLGFVYSTIIAMVGVMLALSVKKWYFYLIIIAIIFGIDFVFRDLLSIQLP